MDNEINKPETEISSDSELIEKYTIDPRAYHWTYRSIQLLLKFLNLTIQTHGDEALWQEGDIFLFNHFARFEAIIPQYLIYEKTGQFSRSIASKELFSEDSVFCKYLIGLGGIPNDADSLMYQVAKDVLNNHKLVAFPEGGIVKDRRVLNDKGQYQIFSRSTGGRRKQHTGPAVIALALSIFKATVKVAHQQGKHNELEKWAIELGLDGSKALLKICERPTRIIPCCITFYPIRISDNALRQGFEFFYSDLKKRLSEELLIEGNLLLKETDMDIQLGEPIVVEEYWSRWENKLLSLFSDQTELSLEDLFLTEHKESNWGNYLFKAAHRRNINTIRDAYMKNIYAGLTLNVAHISSTIISYYLELGKTKISCQKLHELVYLTTKNLQPNSHLFFHKTIVKPTIYRSILTSNSDSFKQFLKTVYAAGLIKKEARYYTFQKPLLQEHGFDEIRYENPIAVYDNEASPIEEIEQSLNLALTFKNSTRSPAFADMLFDDEMREYLWDLDYYQKSKYAEVNNQQTITTSTEPYRLLPEKHNGECVVLTHGLLSSPAELRELGEKFVALGYVVLGVRLKGHGTSPWDLHERTHKEWIESLKQNIRIAQCYSTKVHVIGFSSGSLLTLFVAANKSLKISSVVACSTPITFIDPFVKFAKIADFGNKFINAITGSEGVFPFKENIPEHPHINYRDIPINAISELLTLIDKTTPRLKKISCPILLIQGDNDPVVDPSSMEFLLNNIPEEYREYEWVSSNRHGIIYENTANCQQRIIDFVAAQSK